MGDVAFSVQVARLSGLLAFVCVFTPANSQTRDAGDLADLSLEELANLEVTSVSRRAERLSDAAASLFVITGDDIRRSGVTSLPEALRLAPNLEVARINGSQYAISARGFNNSIGNKLLVLIDGRTVYTPLFSGVFWDAQDTLLEDIERIEVISGPGATLWGANAVNGIINVITRSAADTRGTLAEGGIGNRERGIAARHGIALAGGALRFYGKAFERKNTVRADGTSVRDEWQNQQAGFRGDWGTAAGGFTLQGDVYRGSIEQAGGGDTDISGGNLLARMTRQLAGSDRLQVQLYLDNAQRDIPRSFGERLNTVDAEAQHSFQALAGHFVTWGGGHRRAYDNLSNSPGLAFLPASTTLKWTNVFAQDEWHLREQLRLTVGAKLEHNVYTGTEFLPSARLAWKPDARQLVWTALSRAVRAPSRLDRDLFVPGQAPFLIAGGPDFRSEIAKVFELGYRAQPSARLSYSVTGFYSAYDHLRSVEPAGGGVLVLGNKMEGRTKGLESWGTFQATSRWRLSAGALFLDQDLHFKPGSGDTNVAAAGNDPKHQFTLRSSLDLSGQSHLDLMARYVGELPNPRVPAYSAVDARYALHVRRDLELSVTGQNLFDRRHPEFGSPATRSEIERGVFVRVKWSR
jgi:iron complex outermembrane receptor protein